MDSSPDDLTRKVVEKYPSVRYFSVGYGENTMGKSYNFGVKQSKGEILFFVDDVEVKDNWLTELVGCYKDKEVYGAGGRVIIHRKPLSKVSSKEVGRVRQTEIIGNFDVDYKEPLEVDTLQGIICHFAKRCF